MPKVEEYLARKRHERPNLANLSEEQQYELTGITRDGKVTMVALLLFGLYPQLSIIATCVPAEKMGILDSDGNRFTDTSRIEITNPGGLYGRLTIDQLGNAQPDTRNPVLVTAMETLGKTENRYSGIPTIRFAMENRGLPEPVFLDQRSEFAVALYNSESATLGALRVRLQKGRMYKTKRVCWSFAYTPNPQRDH